MVLVTRLGPMPVRWVAEHTNPDGLTGSLRDALAGADVFVGVSGPGILEPDDLRTMADQAIVFALANPDPEVDPAEAEAVVVNGISSLLSTVLVILAIILFLLPIVLYRNTGTTTGGYSPHEEKRWRGQVIDFNTRRQVQNDPLAGIKRWLRRR